MPAVNSRSDGGSRCGPATATVAACLAVAVAAAGGERRVMIRGVDHPAAATGELVSLDDSQAQWRLAEGTQRVLSRRDLWFLVPLRQPATEAAASGSSAEDVGHERGGELALVLLTNNDWWWAEDVAIADERLRLRLALPRNPAVERDTVPTRPPSSEAPSCDLPLEFVRGIVWPFRARPPTPHELAAAGVWQSRPMRRGWLTLQRASFPQDALLLENGDRVEGELQACDGALCRIQTAVGEVQLPRERVATLALASDLLLPPPDPERAEWALVLLRNGTRITAHRVIEEGEEWVVRPAVGGVVRLPWWAVERIDFFGERVEPLSARTPQQVEFRPYLDRDARWERDRNLTGGPLLLRGVPQGWGLGVASGHRLTWEVAEDGRFAVTVGIDDAAEGGGSVEFVLRGDDRELARSGRLTGADPPLDLGPVSLTGIRRLTLEVEYSDRGDIQDLADWCRPTLLKGE